MSCPEGWIGDRGWFCLPGGFCVTLHAAMFCALCRKNKGARLPMCSGVLIGGKRLPSQQQYQE